MSLPQIEYIRTYQTLYYPGNRRFSQFNYYTDYTIYSIYTIISRRAGLPVELFNYLN